MIIIMVIVAVVVMMMSETDFSVRSKISFCLSYQLIIRNTSLVYICFLAYLSPGYIIVFIGKMIYFPYISHLITEGISEFRPPGHSNIDI